MWAIGDDVLAFRDAQGTLPSLLALDRARALEEVCVSASTTKADDSVAALHVVVDLPETTQATSTGHAVGYSCTPKCAAAG